MLVGQAITRDPNANLVTFKYGTMFKHFKAFVIQARYQEEMELPLTMLLPWGQGDHTRSNAC